MKMIYTKDAPEAVGPYSQAMVCGNQVYTSGQIGLDPATGSLAGDTLEAQTEQVIRNLAAVLKAAGSYQELHSLVVNRQPNALCADSCIRLEKLMRQAQQLCLRLTENFMDCLNGK